MKANTGRETSPRFFTLRTHTPARFLRGSRWSRTYYRLSQPLLLFLQTRKQRAWILKRQQERPRIPTGTKEPVLAVFCLRARLKTIAGIAAFALFLNACASIPTTSAIYSAEIKQEHVKQNIRYLPAGPKAFQTQEETVEGFVLAGAGVSNNFAVAREFIAPEHKNSWAPLTQVYITQGGLSYTQRNPKQKNIVSASTLVVGALDSFGTLKFFQPRNITQNFILRSVEGSWKLEFPPNAIFLPQQVFFDLFTRHTAYFYDSVFAHFVPDIRWRIPKPGDFSSAIADLFAGPSLWIRNATATAIPNSLRFVRADRISNTHMQIHMQGELDTNSVQLALLFEQIRKTVRSSYSSADIELYLNGNRVPPPRKIFFKYVPVDFASFPPLASLPSGLATVDLSKLIVNQNLSAVHTFMNSIKASRGSFSTKYKQFVFLGERGIYKTDFAGENRLLLRSGRNMLEPRMDAFGNIWVWDNAHKDGRLSYHTPTATTATNPTTVLVPAVGKDVRAFAFSPDAARMAVLVADNEKVLLHILSVARGPGGISIADGITLPVSGTNAHDVDWLDSVTISVLASDSHAGRSIRNYTIGEYLPESSSLPGAMQIVGGGYLPNAKVATSDGLAFTSSGKRWRAEQYSVGFFVRQAPGQ